MPSAKATFTALPVEIHTIIFSFVEAHYQRARKIKAWKRDPLPNEIKQLAFINQQWRRLVIGRKFKSQHLPRIEDVRELASLTASNPVVTSSLSHLTVFVTHTDLPELWGQILKWAEEGVSLQSLVIKPSYGQTNRTSATGTEGGGKYTLYEFADLANAEALPSVPIAIENLELNVSITDPAEDSDLVLQFGSQSMKILLSRLRMTTSLKLDSKTINSRTSSTCGYTESIIKLQSERMPNLTTLQLKYSIFMSRQPYNTSTRSFYLDDKIDDRGDNLSNLLRQLSKRLKKVFIRYDRATSEIFEPKERVLSDGEAEDWPYLHTFHLTFSDIDAYGYRRSEPHHDTLQGMENREEEEEEEGELDPINGDQEYQDIPKNDNDGFDWLNSDIVDDKTKYKDDRTRRTATPGVRDFYLIAAKAVANKMRAIQSFKMSMNLSFNSQVYMEYTNQPLNPKLVIIGHQIVKPGDLPENEDEEGVNELSQIFKEGIGEDVKIKYNLPMSL
ncbi:hypothetical protein H072_11396 [Dactylellina haptotyla CBS 200.50]|uniref:Uncharacterized protein n=1 Tax=Dactylellina haptotyla (strain CBS 200.50) TaxID=1284197 RepID=S8BIW5_DACHA|nr:hypothetical protein H072_11396 [Dactylellina haptotyla CBS 200.50]